MHVATGWTCNVFFFFFTTSAVEKVRSTYLPSIDHTRVSRFNERKIDTLITLLLLFVCVVEHKILYLRISATTHNKTWTTKTTRRRRCSSRSIASTSTTIFIGEPLGCDPNQTRHIRRASTSARKKCIVYCWFLKLVNSKL